MTASEADKAYIAGFIDGEGCIQIASRNDSYYQASVQVTNTNKEILEWLLSVYPGNGLRTQIRHNKKHKLAYRAVWTGIKARTLLLEVRPYLRMKHIQCDIAVKFIESQMLNGRHKISDDMIEERQEMYEIICRLNKRGA